MSEAERLAGLLATAQQALEQEILPGLDEERRVLVRHITQVMALAATSLRDGGAGERAERDALLSVLGASEPLELDAVRARIVAELRAGRFDGEREASLLAAFRARLGRSGQGDDPAGDRPGEPLDG